MNRNLESDPSRDSLRELTQEQLRGSDTAEAPDAAQLAHEVECQRRVQQTVAAHFANAAVPSDLAQSVQSLLDEEDRREHPRGEAPPIALRTRRRAVRWRMGFGLAATLAVVGASLWLLAARQSLPQAAAADFARLQAGALVLSLPAPTPAALEREFAQQSLLFEVRVLDLAMMDYRVSGGAVHALGHHPSALFVYQSVDGNRRLLCQMYQGDMDELPTADQMLEHNGIAFRVYRLKHLTAVFWQEGDVICVLVSDLETAQVVQLAFAKAERVAV